MGTTTRYILSAFVLCYLFRIICVSYSTTTVVWETRRNVFHPNRTRFRRLGFWNLYSNRVYFAVANRNARVYYTTCGVCVYIDICTFFFFYGGNTRRNHCTRTIQAQKPRLSYFLCVSPAVQCDLHLAVIKHPQITRFWFSVCLPCAYDMGFD